MIPSQIERLDLGIILISITAVINYGVGTYCVIKGKKTIQLHSKPVENTQTDTYSTLGVILS